MTIIGPYRFVPDAVVVYGASFPTQESAPATTATTITVTSADGECCAGCTQLKLDLREARRTIDALAEAIRVLTRRP